MHRLNVMTQFVEYYYTKTVYVAYHIYNYKQLNKIIDNLNSYQ